MTQSTPQQRALIGAGNAAKIAEEMKRSLQDSLMKQIFSAVHLKQIDKWITQSGVPATDTPRPSVAWSSWG